MGDDFVILTGITVDGRRIALPPPLRLSLTYREFDPSDRLEAEFPLLEELPRFREIEVEATEGKAVFHGIVDEQEKSISQAGKTAFLAARSLAALLTDNEAIPRNYQNPQLAQLYAVHAAPYGLRGFWGNDSIFGGEYSVEKGMTEWDAVEGFCRRYLGVVPRVGADGILRVGLPEWTLPLRIGGAYLPLLWYRERHLPQKRLSEIRIRTKREEGYVSVFTDPKALQDGIRRRRLLNPADGQNSRELAKELFQSGRLASWRAEAGVAGEVFLEVGSTVVIQRDPQAVLTVCGVSYRQDQDGKNTVLTLRKGEEQIKNG